MARIRIQLPEHFIFETQIPVRITDLNYGNHLGHDTLLSLLHEARVQFLASLGYSEGDIEGVGIILGDLAVEYKSEVFHPDMLRVRIGYADISATSCDFLYHVASVSTEKVVALAKTGLVFYDYQRKSIARVPARWIEILQRAESLAQKFR